MSDKTEMTIAGILRPKQGVTFGSLAQGVYYTKAFQDRYMEDAYNSEIVRNENYGIELFWQEKEKLVHIKPMLLKYTDFSSITR